MPKSREYRCGNPVTPLQVKRKAASPPARISGRRPGELGGLHMSDILVPVLIVEDHTDIAQSMALLLGLHGCRVNIAQTGTEALELAVADPPDLVLLDIGLPGMNEWELARHLRDRAPGKQPVIVALTGYGQYETGCGRPMPALISTWLSRPIRTSWLASCAASGRPSCKTHIWLRRSRTMPIPSQTRRRTSTLGRTHSWLI